MHKHESIRFRQTILHVHSNNNVTFNYTPSPENGQLNTPNKHVQCRLSLRKLY